MKKTETIEDSTLRRIDYRADLQLQIVWRYSAQIEWIQEINRVIDELWRSVSIDLNECTEPAIWSWMADFQIV